MLLLILALLLGLSGLHTALLIVAVATSLRLEERYKDYETYAARVLILFVTLTAYVIGCIGVGLGAILL